MQNFNHELETRLRALNRNSRQSRARRTSELSVVYFSDNEAQEANADIVVTNLLQDAHTNIKQCPFWNRKVPRNKI